MHDEEFSKLVIFENEKRGRNVIRRVARQIAGSEAGEFLSEIEGTLNASEVPLAIHMLRVAYEERGIQ